jgi:PAS domain S-box-containing protein
MPAEKEYLVRIESVLKPHKRGLTIAEISQKMHMNRNSVAKYLDILVTAGRVERNGFGNCGVFSLSNRVPVSSLMNFSSEFVIVLTEQGRIIQVNEGLLTFFGVTRKDIEEKILDDVPVEMIRTLKNLEIFRQPGILKECIVGTSTQVSGETYYFQARALPILFEDGGHGFTILLENVTPQKRYEQELIRSEARYRAIIEDQTDLICRRLPDSTITFVNDAFCRFFGRKSHELLGTAFNPVIASPIPGDVPGEREGLFQTSTTEDRVVLDNGSIRWIQWKNRILHNEAGQIVEIQSVGRDITGQREREKEILLRDCAIARSSYPIALFDMIGRAIYLNSAFLSFFGYPDDREIIGNPVEKCFARTDAAPHNIQQIAAALREQGHWEGIFEARKRDGSRFTAGFYGRLIRDDRYFPRGGIVLFTRHPREAPPDPEKKTPAATDGNADRNQALLQGRYARTAEGQGRSSPVATSRDPVPGDEAGPGQHPAPCSATDNPAPPISFMELVDFILDPTFILDPGKTIIAWNRAMEIFTDVKKEEVIGSPGDGRAFSIYPGNRPMLIDLLDLPEDVCCREHPDVRRYGDTLFLEQFIPGFRGTAGAYIYAKAAYLLDPEGIRIGAIETVCDVTDWRNAQKILDKMRKEIDITFTGLIRQLEGTIGTLDDPPAGG